ncbi:MAG: DUF2780 domain-containing protein [Ignavibacteria bacterium]|nr:DUF2780 domain-containing protein [Ignavibacteria bacterium]MBK8381197.1 DUF2780 domain-containing protein [Ignavibacteria bacterium]MBL0106400.1 DUF2780 domain-containing protein [Ignavibacteria bacterium]
MLFSSCTGSLGDIGKTMALVNTLDDLGISPTAAIGSIGGILSLANGKLNPADLSKITQAFPDSKNIMKEAKKLGVGNVTDMAGLGKTFSKLGLNPADVTKMIPAVTKYVGANGGTGAADILGGLLK